MDILTYVIVAGWVCMYFMPSFLTALLTATAVAGIATLLVASGSTDGPLTPAAFGETAMTLGPIAFVAVFVAWPLGLAIRHVQDWWRGKVTGT